MDNLEIRPLTAPRNNTGFETKETKMYRDYLDEEDEVLPVRIKMRKQRIEIKSNGCNTNGRSAYSKDTASYKARREVEKRMQRIERSY